MMQVITNINNRYFIGKDYSNLYQKKIEAIDKYYEDFIDRTVVPRAPWHDEALVVICDVARHFIQRCNIHKVSLLLLLLNKTKHFLNNEPYQIDAQCVRSIGTWSTGTTTTEISIQNAYIEMINIDKYFIYIENQYFITVANNSKIRNQITDALYQRIQRAHTSKDKFRVYILLPLLTGYDDPNSVRAALHFIMHSIVKSEESLFKRLEAAGVPPNDYISFFGTRQHDKLMGNLVTEIVYVHSKLMIIDDRMAICGSANINDRSLLGKHDSEVCIVINDIEEEECQFDGQLVRIGKFCSTWRRRLFSMLLGTLWENKYDVDVSDPICDEFYNYFRQVARTNTLIYEEVFAPVPTDCVRRIDQINEYMTRPKLKDINLHNAEEKLNCIRGLVVEYPLYFLDEEHYQPSYLTFAGLAPHVVWT